MTTEAISALISAAVGLVVSAPVWGPKLYKLALRLVDLFKARTKAGVEKARIEAEREKAGAEERKAEREASGAHVAAWVDAERRCGVLEATVARLEERLARYEDQAKRTAADLSRAMAKIDRQAEEIEQLRRRNTELTRELRDAYARLESQPPLTRIG